MENKRKVGDKGEELATKYLEKLGFTIIIRNFRFSRLGEIDIIAFDNDILCFIEVKSRRNLKFGRPCEAVNLRKQNVIRKIAQIFIIKNKCKDPKIRFDIVEVLYLKDNPLINIIKNAF